MTCTAAEPSTCELSPATACSGAAKRSLRLPCVRQPRLQAGQCSAGCCPGCTRPLCDTVACVLLSCSSEGVARLVHEGLLHLLNACLQASGAR